MKLRKETVAIFITLLIGLLIVSSIFIATITLTSYTSLENQYMQKDLRQAVNKLQDEEDILSATVSDWGAWDDAYDYVNGEKPDFEDINLFAETYDNLRLNLIIYTNRSGGIVYTGMYDLTKKTLVPVPPEIFDTIAQADYLMDPGKSQPVTTGIVMLPDNPMIIASRPVTHSEYPGEPGGMVIMGRYLDAGEIGRLSSLTQPSLTFARLDGSPSQSGRIFRIRQQGSGSPLLIEPVNRDLIGGYAVIQDISGRDALLLSITEPRGIYQQGVDTTFLFIIIILATGFLFGLSVLFILNRLVLSRLDTLNRQVSSVGASHDLHQRVAIGGDDEFAELAAQINRMLETIETTQDGLRTSEEKYRSLTENMLDTLFSADLENRVTYVSPQINQYGFLATDLIGKPLDSLIHPDDADRFRKDLSREFETGARFTSTFRIRDRWGNIHWIEEKSTLRLDQKGKPEGIYGILRNVSDRKRAEDAIELANRKLNLMNNITRHDILNTLTGLFGLVDMAIASGDRQSLDELLGQIKAHGRLIQRQISFTREYQDVGVQAPVWQNVRGIICKATENIRAPGISFDVGTGEYEVLADPLLEKVFYNLVDNAVRYGGHLTCIRFSFHAVEDHLLVICEDDGVGIPDDQKEEIFERGVGKNTGLGLFLTREILLITGIRIRETGMYGKGARFEIAIPPGTWRIPGE